MGITVIAYGQEQPRIVEKYEKHVRTGNLLIRWYYDLRGTSTVWKERLILYDNRTYRYVYEGGECETFDRDESGSWEKTENLLLLNSEKHYIIKKDKLYNPDTPINEEAWVMRRVK